MKTNRAGLDLIAALKDEYDECEPRTDAEKAVTALAGKYLTNSNQFSALVSLVMFLGIDAFKESRILRYIRKGDLRRAADCFDFYIYDRDETGKREIDPYLIDHRALKRPSSFCLRSSARGNANGRPTLS